MRVCLCTTCFDCMRVCYKQYVCVCQWGKGGHPRLPVSAVHDRESQGCPAASLGSFHRLHSWVPFLAPYMSRVAFKFPCTGCRVLDMSHNMCMPHKGGPGASCIHQPPTEAMPCQRLARQLLSPPCLVAMPSPRCVAVMLGKGSAG